MTELAPLFLLWLPFMLFLVDLPGTNMLLFPLEELPLLREDAFAFSDGDWAKRDLRELL